MWMWARARARVTVVVAVEIEVESEVQGLVQVVAGQDGEIEVEVMKRVDNVVVVAMIANQSVGEKECLKHRSRQLNQQVDTTRFWRTGSQYQDVLCAKR